MQDRLADLKKKNNSNPNHIDNPLNNESSLETKLRATQNQITADIKKLKDFGTTINTLTINHQSKGIDDIIPGANSLCVTIRQKIQLLKAENDRLVTSLSDDENKIRDNIYQILLKSFIDALQFYNDAQKEHKTKFVERVTREARIVNPQITEREIHEMIETGQTDNIFAGKVEERRHVQAVNALKFITQQKEDLKSLEKSINELHQLFIELSSLVMTQAPRLEYVVEEMGKARDTTAAAVDNLDKAEKECNKRRKAIAVTGVGVAAVGTAAAGGAGAVVAAKAAGAAACLVM
eukprot:TRINITY_DN6708_c0_g1_i1.p1 TRINITY_DN6708_c0_g1~~TRINITY_DN6708_c0_g1_i1.p1  ORF type:complete len:293 (-),score=59.29 TRINITY_DN6708_c0_g1_i1:87-965(-)